jgi:hypothetical protein
MNSKYCLQILEISLEILEISSEILEFVYE